MDGDRASEATPRAEKARLRRALRDARRALPGELQARARRAVRDVVRGDPRLAAARTLAVYVASDGEIDLADVAAEARARGAAILLPRLRSDGALELVAAGPDTALAASGPGGTLEPTGEAADLARVARPAVLLTPAVALDRRGQRLGRGGGAYDRLIPDLRAAGWTIVGVCHAAQVVERLPVEPHDAAVDLILADDGLRGAEPRT